MAAGSVADYYIDILRRPFIANWAMRYGADLKTPFASIQGPKAMIIDETAGSGGDLLPWMFHKYKMGPLVGQRTWGGLVGVLGFPVLMDGGTDHRAEPRDLDRGRLDRRERRRAAGYRGRADAGRRDRRPRPAAGEGDRSRDGGAEEEPARQDRASAVSRPRQDAARDLHEWIGVADRVCVPHPQDAFESLLNYPMAAPRTTLALRVANLRKTYKDVVAVDGIDLDVALASASACSARTAPARRPRWRSGGTDRARLGRRRGPRSEVGKDARRSASGSGSSAGDAARRQAHRQGDGPPLPQLLRARAGADEVIALVQLEEKRAARVSTSRAARSSGSRSPARSSAIRSCSFSTSRRPVSIRRRGGSCGTSSPTSRRPAGRSC